MTEAHSHLLKVSGSIDPGKEKEFRQTVQFVFNHLSTKCKERSLSVDSQDPHRFHIFLLWMSLTELISFKQSNEFELLSGLFQTIGKPADALTGHEMDIRLFDLTQQNN